MSLVMSKPKTMTCEAFCEGRIADELDTLIQEMFWQQNFSAEACFEVMKKWADAYGVTLTDLDDFDYENWFWELWKCTEKGLS